MRWRAGRRAGHRGGGGGPGGLAGSQLRLLTAASPPPAGPYGASLIPPGPWTELPGLGVGAGSAVSARRRHARSRPTPETGGEGEGGVGGRYQPGCPPGDSVEAGTGPPAFAAPCPLTSQRGQRRREPAFRAAGATDGGWGRWFTGKIPGIKGPLLGPFSLGRFRSGEYRAVSP